MEDAVEALNRGEDDLNARDTFGFGEKSSLANNLKRLEGHVMFEDDDEEQRLDEEKKKKEMQQSPSKDLYFDKNGQPFDPSKKFGVIAADNLIYDRITSSHPLNLPVDYYAKYIQSTLPQKDSGKWFIRPHHVQTLTQHLHSVKDDVLNTRYFSHYDPDFGKKVERNEAEESIKVIEAHLWKLKQQQIIHQASENVPDYT